MQEDTAEMFSENECKFNHKILFKLQLNWEGEIRNFVILDSDVELHKNPLCKHS